jgi:hypothetical protein
VIKISYNSNKTVTEYSTNPDYSKLGSKFASWKTDLFYLPSISFAVVVAKLITAHITLLDMKITAFS